MTESYRAALGDALFSSAYQALLFALNFEDSRIPGPVMNREMSAPQRDHAKVAAIARSYTGTSRRGSPTTLNRPSVALGGTQDRAVMAGWILQRFQQLELIQRLVLTITVMRPRSPCSCGSACCRGWTLRYSWVDACRIMVEHLKSWAEMDKESGKRGYSTDPRLRQALIEDYAKPAERRASVKELAELAEVTTVTAAAHRKRIYDYLDTVHDAAWTDLAAIFDAHGITGIVPD